MSKLTRMACGLAVAALIPVTGAAAVLVVDPLDPAAFSSISLAVAASTDGDTILIKRSGTYSGFTVNGRSLTITADKGVEVAIFSLFPVVPVTVKNVAANQQVVLRGIDGAMIVEDNAGPVRVEDCVMTGVFGSCSELHNTPGSPGATVHHSASVAFVRCQLTGGPSITSGGPFPCTSPEGVGIEVFDATVTLYDTTLDGLSPTALYGPDAVLYDDLSPGRHFEATSPLRKGQLGQLRFDGEPGDVVLLLVAPGPGQLPAPLYDGVLLVSPITAAVVLGILPGPTGQLNIPLVISDLPPSGLDALDLHLQAAFGVSASSGLLGPSSILTVIDPAF